MPEHREKTPGKWRDLESFLWHDFDVDAETWVAWIGRRKPALVETEVRASFHDAAQLHAALRVLQAANNGIVTNETEPAYHVLNGLVVHLGVRPRLDRDGNLHLASDRLTDPVGPLLVAALESMEVGEWRRFKLCREPTCRASYYDASKAVAKTWCSMETCGSRDKMRRYRARV